MENKRVFCLGLMLFLTASLSFANGQGEMPYGGIIKIANIAHISGDIKAIGAESVNAVNMRVDEINAAGGITVGQQNYKLQVITEDDKHNADAAVTAMNKVVNIDEVLAVIGPYASTQAIAAGELANNKKTLCISPWSSNVNTTKDRPYVFRCSYIDPYQGKVVAAFVQKEFAAKKVAVIYDTENAYSAGISEVFKQTCEQEGVKVVAYETFTTGNTDFSAQLSRIIASGAELLFIPQFWHEVSLILTQATRLGWSKPVVGSDSWSSAPDQVKKDVDIAQNNFFSGHFAAKGAGGEGKRFADKYSSLYNSNPGDVAALAYDTVGLLAAALENTVALTGDLSTDRQAIRNGMAKIQNWKGITGEMSFNEEGDPLKAVTMLRIDELGDFSFYTTAMPQEIK